MSNLHQGTVSFGEERGLIQLFKKKKKNLQVNYWFTCMFQKEILPGSAG